MTRIGKERHEQGITFTFFIRVIRVIRGSISSVQSKMLAHDPAPESAGFRRDPVFREFLTADDTDDTD